MPEVLEKSNSTPHSRSQRSPSRSSYVDLCQTIAQFVIVGSFLTSLSLEQASARQYEVNFDGPEISWQVRFRPGEARVEAQERRRDGAHQARSEFVQLRIARENTPVRLEHPVPAVRVIDELTASLWFQSDRPGATLAMRISFRGAVDPESGNPLSIILFGDKYEGDMVGKWRQLKCRAADKSVSDHLRKLRARGISVNLDSIYVDQVVLGFQMGAGTTEMMIDDLDLGPIVPLDAQNFTPDAKKSADTAANAIAPASLKSDPGALKGPAEFRLHKLRVEGKPFFPRIAPYRQERPETFSDAGFNTTWVADLDSISNSSQFRDRGVWLTITPPYAKGANGEPLDSDDASLLPFAPSTSSVLFWMLGARITGDSRPRLASWTNQVRDADRTIRRPLAADVADDERIASRHLDMLGLSRHIVNTGLSFGDYRDEMMRRRDRAWPGTFCFTWIQTEPAQELMDLKQLTELSPVLEPEQIRLQVYAGLAAGCRGIGFWTTSPLDSDGPGARERLLTITQLNLELSLLEEWLATGATTQLIPFTVETNQTLAKNRAAAGKKPDKASDKKSPEALEEERVREKQLSAALVRAEAGALLLPMWLEERSQYVPAQLAAYSATIVVPGGGETATAWEITTTGRVQNLTRESIAGGIKIELPRFDQTAAILITSNLSVIDRINQRISAVQERSANVTVELSRLKFDRVRKVDEQLASLGIRQTRGSQWIEDARMQIQRAETALKQQQFHTARQAAGIAMQSIRILQRAHWDEGVAKLPTPSISPLATCFQTLPAHWKLARANSRIDSRNDVRSPRDEQNKLPSGEFEDLDTLIASGWRHVQRSVADVQCAAELNPSAKQGRFSLRLAAEPTVAEPGVSDFHIPPVSVTSPDVSTHAGEFVKITGWVKTPHPIVRSTDGALIYDSLMGRTGAIRILNAPDWQRFEFWRPVAESQSLTLNVEMHGLGEVLIDDVRITTASLPADLAESFHPTDSPIKPAKNSTLDRFDLRRLSQRRK